MSRIWEGVSIKQRCLELEGGRSSRRGVSTWRSCAPIGGTLAALFGLTVVVDVVVLVALSPMLAGLLVGVFDAPSLGGSS